MRREPRRPRHSTAPAREALKLVPGTPCPTLGWCSTIELQPAKILNETLLNVSERKHVPSTESTQLADYLRGDERYSLASSDCRLAVLFQLEQFSDAPCSNVLTAAVVRMQPPSEQCELLRRYSHCAVQQLQRRYLFPIDVVRLVSSRLSRACRFNSMGSGWLSVTTAFSNASGLRTTIAVCVARANGDAHNVRARRKASMAGPNSTGSVSSISAGGRMPSSSSAFDS